MKQLSLKKIVPLVICLLIVFSSTVCFTFSSLFDSKIATGYITFNPQYKLILSKSSSIDTEFNSSDIEINKSFFSADVSAVINLSKTEEVASSINNGTIVGEFNKYSWNIDGLDFDADSLVYSVYANSTFSYYPVINIILEYVGTGFENVHLSFPTEQNKIFSIISVSGEYYSYYIQTDSYNFVVTYPKLSENSGGLIQKNVRCFVLGSNNKPLQFVGTNIDEINFQLNLLDLLNGVYSNSSYIDNVKLKVNFNISNELII